MNRACSEFRSRLERSLAGKVESGELRRLGWHEHLLGCADCRALVESEEALELLLASLPEPKLPPEMARRILARLRELRETSLADARRAADPLDALLELDREMAPPDLAQRVLAGLGSERARVTTSDSAEQAAGLDERLDRLLDRALLHIETPAGLAARVRARLRELPLDRPIGSPARRGGSRQLFLRLAAAILVLIGAAGALWRALRTGAEGTHVADDRGEKATWSAGAPAVGQPVPDDLLASLDLLESWEALEAAGATATDELAEVEPSDLLVLELLAEADREYGLVPEGRKR